MILHLFTLKYSPEKIIRAELFLHTNYLKVQIKENIVFKYVQYSSSLKVNVIKPQKKSDPQLLSSI